MAREGNLLPAGMNGPMNIDVDEDERKAGTESGAQAGAGGSRSNAVTGGQPAGDTEVKECRICWIAPVNAGFKHGNR